MRCRGDIILSQKDNRKQIKSAIAHPNEMNENGLRFINQTL
jgi:hypothetical protein